MCPLHQNYQQVLILYMKHVHHRTLSAACSLNVSILSDMPEKSDIEASQYKAEQDGRGQFRKVANARLAYARSKSVFEGEQAAEEEEGAIKCSMLTDARMDYFRAIEKALLLENQNLKSHNSFLLEQIRKLYLRQKRIKQEALAQQALLKQMKKVNRELEHSVQLLSNDLMQQIRSVQLLLSEQQLDHTPTAGYRFKALEEIDHAASVSLTLPESLQTMKYIFSKADDESYVTQQSSSVYFPTNNLANDYYQLQRPDFRKALHYTDNMRRKIGSSSSNHPILKDLDDKINSLSNQLAQRAKTAKKSNYFKKTRTLAD